MAKTITVIRAGISEIKNETIIGANTPTRVGTSLDDMFDYTVDSIVPAPVNSVNGKTGDVALDKADVGLQSVDDTADSDKPISGPQANAFSLKMDKPVIAASSQTGAVSLDLNAYSILNLSLTGDITALNITGGVVGLKYEVNIIKDVSNRSFDIAPDYQQIPYAIGVRVGVPTTQPLGRLFYKCKTTIAVGEVFDPTKWDLDIKMQGDVLPVLSYSENKVDQLKIEPQTSGSMYYSLTLIHDVGEK